MKPSNGFEQAWNARQARLKAEQRAAGAVYRPAPGLLARAIARVRKLIKGA